MPYAFSSDVANDKFIITNLSSMQLGSLEIFASLNNARRSKTIIHDKKHWKLHQKSNEEELDHGYFFNYVKRMNFGHCGKAISMNIYHKQQEI